MIVKFHGQVAVFQYSPDQLHNGRQGCDRMEAMGASVGADESISYPFRH